MYDNINLSPDVLIIGGGPAGATIGTYLARTGYQVALLEKGRHPRFHVGESLLPMNLPIFERLGVLDQVARIGVKKLGADFTWDDETGEYRTYRFDRALGECPSYAFEVRRAEFDQLLFDNCRAAGVKTFEMEEATAVTPLGERGWQVTSRTADGTRRTWKPRFMVDATGRDTLMAARNRWKTRNRRHASAAIFGHFRGVARRPGDDQGNISIYWFAHGWIWMIPLRDDVVSVGAVCWPEYLKQRRTDPETFLEQTLDLSPPARARLGNATRITAVGVTGNYSYRSTRLWDDGMVVVGDAYAFIDPVFSSGVYLAMDSAEQAVALAESWLDGYPRRFRMQARRYERRVESGLSSFSWFIYRFTSPAMRALFRNPRNILKVEQAVISLLAGDVFDNRDVKRRLVLFRFIYRLSWLLNWREARAARRRRIRSARVEFAGATTDSS